MRPGKRRLLNPFIEPEFVAEQVEQMKASIRAKVEHPFRVIKQRGRFERDYVTASARLFPGQAREATSCKGHGHQRYP